MKKYYFLIIVALILGLVLTGCSLLSNVGQTPNTGQSGIDYLTKNGAFPNLVALWHFDEGSGVTAYDSSGNPNDGTLMGGTGWTSGKFGQALSFDGVNNYVEVPDSASLDITGEITIECWVKREQAAYQTLISKWSAVDNQRSYLVALTADNNIRFWITSGGTWGTLEELTSSGTVGTEWTHIAATYDGTKMNIYIDSVEDLSQVTTTVPIFAGSAPLMFGVHPAYMTHGWVPGYFKGILDEVRIWDGALTEAQIAQSFALGDPQPDAMVVELGEELFPDGQVVIFTSSFYGLDAECGEHDTVDIYMMSNYSEAISGVSERKKPYTPNGTTGWWGDVDGTEGDTFFSVDVCKDDCKSIHLSLDLISGRSVGFNAQFLPYD